MIEAKDDKKLEGKKTSHFITIEHGDVLPIVEGNMIFSMLSNPAKLM